MNNWFVIYPCLLKKWCVFACFERQEYPSLMCDGIVSKCIQLTRAKGECSACGPNVLLILSFPILKNQNLMTPCNKWHHAPRAERKPQLKLSSFKHVLPTILSKFKEQLKTKILHQDHLRCKIHV